MSTIKPLDVRNPKTSRLKLDKASGAYQLEDVSPGPYLASVAATSYESQEREIYVSPAGDREIFILGPKGLPVLYRGKVQTPFEPPGQMIGVSLDPAQAERTRAALNRWAEQQKLKSVEGPARGRQENVHLYEPSAKLRDEELDKLMTALAGQNGVRFAGRVVKINPETVTFLTPEIVIKFKSHVTIEAIATLLRELSLDLLRTIPYIGNAFLVRITSSTAGTFAVLDACARLVATGLVEYAEPNLVSTTVVDAITPNDYLYPMQWHLPTCNADDAWQLLHDNIGVNSQFGSANLVIAVMDPEKIDTTNPDFTGTVTSGATKVYQVWDFQNIVGNMSMVGGNHGTRCLGITSATANNSIGVAGAAGNCRVMACHTPGVTEVTYSDAYIWMAGLDPDATTPGFPAPISPGADVISNSYGAFTGMAISGTMKDTFDCLTTYGRGGKGVILLFSVGNYNTPNTVFTLNRPWAAYDRTLAIGATSVADDGVTEIHCTYSGISGGATILDVCGPSHDEYVGGSPRWNPPTNYATVTTDVSGTGSLPSSATTSTTLNLAAATGAMSLSVVSTAGFAAAQKLLVGPSGLNGEPATISSVGAGVVNLSNALFQAHAAGQILATGPANCTAGFGGTSSATPLTAGVAALILTANPNLTWTEVRAILRGTAAKIDTSETDPIGIWKDVNGVSFGGAGYLGPNYSRWFGFGRIDAQAAVQLAIDGAAAAPDLVVRDTLADTGTVPSSGAFWASPDLWGRNQSPAMDGAAALPASYAVAGPHQDPKASASNYVYVRVKNITTTPSADFYVRIYLTHWAGLEFVYPQDFIPTNHPGQPIPSPLTPGTYLIGEVYNVGLAGNAEVIVNVPWPAALVPPETVMVGMSTVHWHPCLLAEVSPMEAAPPSGNHVWDSNNLCQRNVTINYVDSDTEFSAMLIAGNLQDFSEYLILEFERDRIPSSILIFLELLDPGAARRSAQLMRSGRSEIGGLTYDPVRDGYRPGKFQGRNVIWLETKSRSHVPILGGPGTLVPIRVGAAGPSQGKTVYELGIRQFNPDRRPTGAAAVELRSKK